MDHIPVTSLGLRFGKYLDPMIDTKLTVVAHEVIEYAQAGKHTYEDDVFYLFRHVEDNAYYCCFVPNDPSDSGPKSTPGIMKDWLEDNLALSNVTLELLPPKNKDWFQDFYLAVVHFDEPSSKLVH